MLTVTVLFCRALALFKAIEPAEIWSCRRMKVLLPESVRMPGPACVRLPVPLMAPLKVGLSERLNTSARVVLLILPTRLPVVPPLSICKVPAEIVVPPV